MKIKYSPAFLLTIMIIASGCRVPEIRSLPGKPGEAHQSVRLKVKLKTESGTDNTKIILGFSDRGDRMIFLGPMNQVLFEIIVRSGLATVIVPKKKEYWEGEFSEFLDSLWGLDLTYNEIKALLLEKRIAAGRLSDNGLRLRIYDSLDKTAPYTIILFSDDIRLEFRVNPVLKREGALDLRRNLERYTKVSIRDMMDENRD